MHAVLDSVRTIPGTPGAIDQSAAFRLEWQTLTTQAHSRYTGHRQEIQEILVAAMQAIQNLGRQV